MEYIRATPNDGETFPDVCSRLEIQYFRGSGYYKLVKSEKISAAKDLVLFDGDAWIAGGSEVRAKLILGAGPISIKPTDLPEGNELFVQSTSPNRKLPEGHDVLFRQSATQASGAVVVTAFRGGGDTIEEGNSSMEIQQQSQRRKKETISGESEDDGIVVWSKLMLDLEGNIECLDESELVKGAECSGVPGDCDLPVPVDLVQKAVSVVCDAMSSVKTWNLMEETIVTPPPPKRQQSFGYTPPPYTRCRYQWQSEEDGRYRLMYFDHPDASYIALEVQRKNYGLVTGNCMSHPFSHSPDYSYANSDGSSRDLPLQQSYLISPQAVLGKLIHDTVLHCGNQEH